MGKCIIANKDKTFELVDGYLLTNGFAAYKVDGKWRVGDYRSGTMVKAGLSTLKACKEFVANMDQAMLDAINLIRERDNYKELTKRASKFFGENYGKTIG